MVNFNRSTKAVFGLLSLLLCSSDLVQATEDAGKVDYVAEAKLNTMHLTEENFDDMLLEFLNKPKDTKPLLLTLVMGECTVGGCVNFSKDLHKLAGIVKAQNRVAHVACSNDGEICRKVPKPKARNGLATLYITKEAIYGFNGDQTMDAVLKFLSADNFMNDEVLEPEFKLYAESALGLTMPFEAKMRKKMEDFSLWAETKSKEIFKKVPHVDRWHPPAKIAIIAVAVLPPIVFVLFYLFVSLQVFYHNYTVD